MTLYDSLDNNIFICKICNEQIILNNENRNSIKINNHLKQHKISKEDYIIKYYYNGIRPTCKCGCGKPVKYVSKSPSKDRICFLDYYSCTHVKPTPEIIQKIRAKSIEKRNNILESLKSLNLTEDDLRNAYYDYVNFKCTMYDITKRLFHDNRTIIKYWKLLKLIPDMNIFAQIRLKHKTYWMNHIREPNYDNYLLLKNNLNDIIYFLQNIKRNISLTELKNIFNLNISNTYLFNYLKNNINDNNLIQKIKTGSVSYIERDFLNVLKFYFPYSKIEPQFKIDNRYFDFKLGKRILIEIDGKYYHNNDKAKINDKLKNEIAKNNNYILIRIGDNDIHKIEILQKIKKIYEKYKI